MVQNGSLDMPGKDLEKYQRGIWQAIGKSTSVDFSKESAPSLSDKSGNAQDTRSLTSTLWQLRTGPSPSKN